MKKSIKKITTLTLAIIFIMTLTLNIAMAAEENIIIYVEVPEEWNEPSLWAWSEDGTNAYDAWPGEKLIEDTTNEGWYYQYVPSWVSSVIVNANEGTVQTAELKTESKDSWVVVSGPEDATVSHDQMTEGALPEGVEMITVNAYVPEEWTMPHLWAWSAPDGTNAFANWPGQELEQSADGWYSFKVPAWVNSVIVNGNLGEVQTTDVSIEAKDVWLVIEGSEEVSVSYEKPVIETPAEEMITIHAKTPSDWIMPSLWAWSAPDGTNVFPNWPGQELELIGEWYTFSVPKWVNSIILNGNVGAVQTSDISIEAKDLWVVVTDSETYEVYYEEPKTDSEEDNSSEIESTNDKETNLEEKNDEKSNTTVYIFIGVLVVALAGSGFYVQNKKKSAK